MCEIKKFNDYAATIILVLVIVVALAIPAIYSVTKNIANQSQEIKLACVIQTDSTGVVSQESYALAESVKESFEIHEHAIEDKYKYYIEQKENVQEYITWGGIIVTIVLSIFGFFGYKSINSIEERIKNSVQDHATSEAVAKAKEYAKERLQDYEAATTNSLGEQVNNKAEHLSNVIDTKFNKVKKEILDDAIDAATVAVKDESNRNIAPRINDIASNTDNIDELQQQVAELKATLEDLLLMNRQIEARISGYTPSTSTPISTSKTDGNKPRSKRGNPDPYNK